MTEEERRWRGAGTDDYRRNYRRTPTRAGGRGCVDTSMKVGCGFVLGVLITCLCFLFGRFSPSAGARDAAADSTLVADSEYVETEEAAPAKSYRVWGHKGKATITTGMEKSEVFRRLGEPDKFDSSSESYTWVVTYRWLTIRFEDGYVSSIDQN